MKKVFFIPHSLFYAHPLHSSHFFIPRTRIPERILLTGSIAYDILLAHQGSFVDSINPQALEQLSLAYVTPHYARRFGGTAANIAWYLKTLGEDPLLVGTVGEDGGSYLARFEAKGIEVLHVERLADHVTPTAIMATDSKERQIIFYHPGADAHGSWPNLADDREDIAWAIVSPRDISVMQKAIHWCEEVSISLVFDPGQWLSAYADDELRRAIASSKATVVNTYEWSLLSERLSMSPKEFLNHCPLLIVTNGEKGVTAYTKEETLHVPVCAANQVVDPTGAGDAFRAGLLTGLRRGWTLTQTLRLGASCGSFAVEQEGPQAEEVTANDVWTRAEETYGEALPE